MTNALTTKSDAALADIQNTQKMCELLMQTPHYRKIGPEGIYAIVTKARSIGLDPLDALNGAMYFVGGKVELASATMNQLIRSAGHSVTKDKRSDETICILHGKRADNGDHWTESFSIDDAKLAGIYRANWVKYPRDMLFARALSRLARQLFPDVIKGCYVQGEIADAPPINEPVPQVEHVAAASEPQHDLDVITAEQHDDLDAWIGDNHTLRTNILKYLKKRYNVDTLEQMPVEIYDRSLQRAQQMRAEAEHAYGEQLQAMGN